MNDEEMRRVAEQSRIYSGAVRQRGRRSMSMTDFNIDGDRAGATSTNLLAGAQPKLARSTSTSICRRRC